MSKAAINSFAHIALFLFSQRLHLCGMHEPKRMTCELEAKSNVHNNLTALSHNQTLTMWLESAC